jgi:hypothetical protein
MDRETAINELRMKRLDDDLLGFATAMKAAQGDEFDWLYFLDKPQKWAPEYAAWVDSGRPVRAEDGAAWEQWLAAMEVSR